MKAVPTAFDGKYKAKPAYWAYVDATKLEPLIQDIVVAEQKGDTNVRNRIQFFG